MDLAIRRRFAFVEVWPELDAVASQGVELARELFTDTVQTFAEYADDETLRLVPGHAYFLDPRPDLPEDSRPARVARRLRLELLPLLRDYLDERLCGGASEAIAGLADRTLVPPAGDAMTPLATSNPTRPRPRATREHTSSESP